ncbi:hypothetical protein LINGRAHAP2_LOCUS29455 [Linum grandiflorum]
MNIGKHKWRPSSFLKTCGIYRSRRHRKITTRRRLQIEQQKIEGAEGECQEEHQRTEDNSASHQQDIFPRIFGIKTSKEAWEVLKNEFKGSEKAISIKCQNLWRQFDNLAMKEGESIKDFHSRVAEIVNQIKVTGETIDEKKIVERILCSLTPKFEHVVVVIEETKDLAKPSMTELMGSLVAHEQRLSRFTNQPLE